MLKISDYLAAIRSALHDDVLSELKSEHARSQLLGAIEVLDKLQGLMEWAPDMLTEQAAALEAGSDRLRTEAGDRPDQPVKPAPAADTGDVEDRVRAESGHMAEWVDWLYAQDGDLGAERLRALELLVRDGVQAALAAERRRISSSDYSSMT